MSAIIHSNNVLSSGNVSLMSQSFTYAPSGLVTASLQYAALASKRASVEKLFAIDSQPPVFPSGLDRGSLSTQRLYMISRSVEQQRGILTINASYAGASLKIEPIKRTERETERSFLYTSPAGTFRMTNPNGTASTTIENLTNAFGYTYVPLICEAFYVEIKGKTPSSIKKPTQSELYYLQSFFSTFWRQAPELGWDGLVSYSPYNRQYFVDTLNSFTIIEDRKNNDITPSVTEVSVRWYI